MQNVIGRVLRRARLGRGFSLLEVEKRSRGRFKPSVLGGYERGERSISLERFCALAELYSIPPDRLLADVVTEMSPTGRREVVIDLTRLSLLDRDEGRAIAELAHRVKMQRGDFLTDVITLRAGDIEALALERAIDPAELIDRVKLALGGPEGDANPRPADAATT